MKRLIKLLFISLVVTFITLNITSYAYAGKTITLIEKKDENGNVIFVDEDGNIYTKQEKTEIVKTTNKDGDEVFVDDENNTYIKEEKEEKEKELLKFVIFACILLILTFIAIIVFY